MKSSTVFKALYLLDGLENITLRETEKRVLDVLRDHTLITRSELEDISGVPERTLRRILIKFENYNIIRSFRIAVKLIQLNPVLIDLFQFTDGHHGYNFGVIRRNISHYLLHRCDVATAEVYASHVIDPLKDDHKEKLGQETRVHPFAK